MNSRFQNDTTAYPQLLSLIVFSNVENSFCCNHLLKKEFFVLLMKAFVKMYKTQLLISIISVELKYSFLATICALENVVLGNHPNLWLQNKQR